MWVHNRWTTTWMINFVFENMERHREGCSSLCTLCISNRMRYFQWWIFEWYPFRILMIMCSLVRQSVIKTILFDQWTVWIIDNKCRWTQFRESSNVWELGGRRLSPKHLLNAAFARTKSTRMRVIFIKFKIRNRTSSIYSYVVAYRCPRLSQDKTCNEWSTAWTLTVQFNFEIRNWNHGLAACTYA